MKMTTTMIDEPIRLPSVNDVLVADSVFVGSIIEKVKEILDSDRKPIRTRQHMLEKVIDIRLDDALKME